MNSATAFHRRRLGLAAPFLFLLVAGCGDYSAYPDDLKYPTRTDLIVKKRPQKEFWYPDQPGTLDDYIAQSGKDDPTAILLDPRQIPVVDPVKYKVFDHTLASLRGDGVPEDVASKLEALKNKDYPSDAKFTEQLTEILKQDKQEEFRDPVLKHAVKQPRERLDRNNLGRSVQDVFGTPKSPTVLVADTKDNALIRDQILELKLDPPTLAKGSVLYRRYCLQCHGVSGDGRGPTGPWVHPHPRDYRQGVFKFISTNQGKPSRADLMRILMTGAEGTSMPSFALLGNDALEEIVSYVIHLSLRGEVEYNLSRALLREGAADDTGKPMLDEPNETLFDQAQMLTVRFAERWYLASFKTDALVQPIKENSTMPEGKEREESIQNGYKYFIGKEGGCIECHRDFGRQVPFKADVWGTPVRPANLTNGVYRGGRRPIDIYWRIRAGIDPSGMPAAGTALVGASADADDKKVWDVVNFVQALPYPAMLPPDIREKVYGKKDAKEKDHPHE